MALGILITRHLVSTSLKLMIRYVGNTSVSDGEPGEMSGEMCGPLRCGEQWRSVCSLALSSRLKWTEDIVSADSVYNVADCKHCDAF